MLKRTIPSLCSALMLVLVPWGLSCIPEPKKPEKAKTETQEGKDEAKTMSMAEIVFDPRNPPAGFTKCHRNHCHRVGGGVASYQQAMQELDQWLRVDGHRRNPGTTADMIGAALFIGLRHGTIDSRLSFP